MGRKRPPPESKHEAPMAVDKFTALEPSTPAPVSQANGKGSLGGTVGLPPLAQAQHGTRGSGKAGKSASGSAKRSPPPPKDASFKKKLPPAARMPPPGP